MARQTTRAFGEDRLEVRADGSRLLTCPVAKEWQPRTGGGQTRAEHPGTAVRWEDQIFEVVEASPLFDRQIRYVLRPWEERHAIRVIRDYDESSETARRAQIAADRVGQTRRRTSILLAPLAGHLPAPVQERMEGDFGAPARAMTIASALPLFVLGVLGVLANRAAAMGGGSDFLPWLAVHPVICLWLAVEHGVRLGIAFLHAEPVGSLEGTIAWEAWRMARRVPADRSPPPAWRGSPASAEQAERDRFRMLEPLLALLSPAEQEALERRFGFEPVRWGRRTMIFLAVLGAVNAFISFGHWLGGGSAPGDAFWFVVGAGLLVEQVRRRRMLTAGRPAGSVLGGLVRPLAKKLLS